MGSWIDTDTRTKHCGGKTRRNKGLYDTTETSRVTYLVARHCRHKTFLLCVINMELYSHLKYGGCFQGQDNSAVLLGMITHRFIFYL
jgi:hypothetical protein